MDAINTALSGLRAQSTRVAAAAENIATAGAEPFTRKEVSLTSSNGGVRAEVSEKMTAPGLYDAGVPYLDDVMSLKTAEIAYKANISVLKSVAEMEQSLIETLA